MSTNKTDDRLIAALEMTMSGLTFNKDDNGLVRIEDENGEPPSAIEHPSMLELTPPPTPKRMGGTRKGIANYLPMEIVCAILEFIHLDRQDVFASTSKVSRMWYYASQQYLYRRPQIHGKNYQSFVSTISPSSTNVKPSPLASLVKQLDLSRLVHHGKPSQTARLLRRAQNSLEEFVAPQASFGYNCIVALGHCQKLRALDLSLISQAINLEDLFRHIQDLPKLVTLYFPRTSVYTRPQSKFRWPQRLERFSLSGAIPDYFLLASDLPETLHELHISHCPFTRQTSVLCLLSSLSAQLTTLSICYPMPCMRFNAMDNVLNLCPNLTYLLISVDYITGHFFDDACSSRGHPLRRLDLDSSGNPGVEHKLSPNDIFIAVAEDRLPCLRIVRVSRHLKWVQRERDDVEDLIDMLEAKSTEAGEKAGTKVGLWEFGNGGAEAGKFSDWLNPVV